VSSAADRNRVVYTAGGYADHDCGLSLQEFNGELPVGSVVQCTTCGRCWKRRGWSGNWTWERKRERRRRMRRRQFDRAYVQWVATCPVDELHEWLPRACHR